MESRPVYDIEIAMKMMQSDHDRQMLQAKYNVQMERAMMEARSRQNWRERWEAMAMANSTMELHRIASDNCELSEPLTEVYSAKEVHDLQWQDYKQYQAIRRGSSLPFNLYYRGRYTEDAMNPLKIVVVCKDYDDFVSACGTLFDEIGNYQDAYFYGVSLMDRNMDGLVADMVIRSDEGDFNVWAECVTLYQKRIDEPVRVVEVDESELVCWHEETLWDRILSFLNIKI